MAGALTPHTEPAILTLDFSLVLPTKGTQTGGTGRDNQVNWPFQEHTRHLYVYPEDPRLPPRRDSLSIGKSKVIKMGIKTLLSDWPLLSDGPFKGRKSQPSVQIES